MSLGEVWQGVEVGLKAYGNNVEKLFYVKPGADPEGINVAIKGGDGIEVSKDGELIIHTPLGDIRFTRPIAYQEIDGKRVDVSASYVIARSDSDEAIPSLDHEIATPPSVARNGSITYAFKVGDYDKAKDLVIDPILQSTFLGGSHEYDWGHGMSIHPTTGDVYVTGETWSADFPGIRGGADTTFVGRSEAFVSRLNSGLTTLYQSTFLGGYGMDSGFGISIHPTTGAVYATGETRSDDFPGIAGGPDTTFSGYSEGFVSRLNSSLTTLLQSTFLGGNDEERGRDIAIHPTTGDVYVTGDTRSGNFPGITGGADTTFAGWSEGFVSRLNSGITTLYQSTYLGGSSSDGNDRDYGFDIAFHPTTGDVYVAGETWSPDFPGIAGGADTTFAGGYEGFVSLLNSGLTTLYQSTYLGGCCIDSCRGISIHPTTRDVYVAGVTTSGDFPRIAGGADTTLGGLREAFVVRLSNLAATFDLPDLVVTQVDGPSNGVKGGRISITFTVKNQGAVSTARSTKVAFYLSTDTNITTKDNRIRETQAPALAPGESFTETIWGRIKRRIPAGNYYIGAIVDYKNRITESNEVNNTGYDAAPITITR